MVSRKVFRYKGKILGIATGTSAHNRVTIELVINLWNLRTNDNGLLTIGGSNVATADIKVPNDYVKFRQSFMRGSQAIMNFIKSGSPKHLEAIAIIYKDNYPFAQFILSQSKPFILMNEDIKKIIKDNLIDLVVYGKKAPFDKCAFFEELYPDFTNRKYALREFDIPSTNTDLSINRCAIESDGFLPQKFRLGSPTPGAENDCTGASFFLEDHLLEVSDVQSRDFDMDDSTYIDTIFSSDTTAQCSTSMESSQYLSMKTSLVHRAVQTTISAAKHDECTPLMLYPEGTNIQLEITNDNQRKRKISSEGLDYSLDYEWSSTKYFRDDWVNKIKLHQLNLLPVSTIEKEINKV